MGIADPDQTTYKSSGSDKIYLMVKGFMVKESFKKTEEYAKKFFILLKTV